MPPMPEMPSITDVTMPSMDDDFYIPSIPNKNLPPKQDKSDKAQTGDNIKKNDAVLKDGLTTEDLIKNLISGPDLLTASDISSLYDSNLFSSISSLSGIKTTNNVNQDSQTVLLQKMLESLEELKQEQKTSSAEEKEQLSLKKQDKENFKSREPSILRFNINGYNVKDSLVQAFFSETEKDGSFLLTADRKYFVNQSPINETFYFLFRTLSSNGSVTTYEVIPTIAQDKKNPNSFLYKMCQMKNLTAQKTGNLVVLHFDQNDFNADMLLNIDVK